MTASTRESVGRRRHRVAQLYFEFQTAVQRIRLAIRNRERITPWLEAEADAAGMAYREAKRAHADTLRRACQRTDF